jgi:predicted O-methyltransferase YrrM
MSLHCPGTTAVQAALGFVVALIVAAGCSAPTPPGEPATGRTPLRADLSPELEKVFADIREADTGQLAVSEADGRFLRLLIVATGATRALEIGGASGYSAIWLGLGLRETGGSLVTIEYDPVRAGELEANIRRAGLDDTVRVVAGDAFAAIPALEGSFDFVFLDAWKPDYLKFFEMTMPRLDPGGVFAAHNVINKRDEMAGFLDVVTTSDAVLTSIVSVGTEGISVSVKR